MQRRAFLFALAWLGACSTTLPLPAGTRQYRSDLRLSGRLSVSYRAEGKPQSMQGKFLWMQRDQQIDIELLTPLGQTMARIAIAPGRARIEQSGGEVREASSIEQLTEQTLGWPLPADGLRYWLQGFVRNSMGQLTTITPEQSGSVRSEGWKLRYAAWQADRSTAVPKRIDFSRETASSELSIRLVIDRWTDEE
ncbi:MAG: lipoprotein insertase outer membrane protein LolB [Burkholderiaceae bacterium]|jgi:outer membrane lipoprotein LolB